MIPTTIVDPEKIAWKGNASQVVFGIPDGLVGILPGHADAVFAIQPCIAKITGEDGKVQEVFLSGGVASVSAGQLKIVADSAETSDHIDQERARKAMERAHHRLSQASGDVDYERARLALARAMYRLKLGC